MTEFSYQLYSSRNHGPIGETLAMLKDCGYSAVEGFGGLYGENIEGTKAALAATGLKMRTGHFGLEDLEADPAGVIETAKALGMEMVIVPFIAPQDRPTDSAGWAAYGKRLDAAGGPVREAGLEFAYHNHEFEMLPTPTGDIPMALILEYAPNTAWECDVAWVAKGGADPVDWFARYRDRITAVHLKDIAPEGEAMNEDGWADLGHGVMNWPGLMEALRETNAKHLIMEHDLPSDDKRFATRSIATAKGL